MVSQEKAKVLVSPKALEGIIGHALNYPHESVHGLLIGSSSDTILDAVAVSHGAPTRPLVEMALGICKDVVGWYTSPALSEDTGPGPVALRGVSGLHNGGDEPVLLVLQNLEPFLKSPGQSQERLLQAYGRQEIGNQWLDPSDTVLDRPEDISLDDIRSTKVHDLLDHLESEERLEWNCGSKSSLK